MNDERVWVPVEVLWDEGLGEEIEWDETGWEDEPLFEPRPRPLLQFLAEPQRRALPAPRSDAGARPRAVEKGPRRKDREGAHLTKRRRKKLRAWELEDEG